MTKFVVLCLLSFTTMSLQAKEVILYAAASLTEVLTELSLAYQKQHPEITISTSYAGSSLLAKQIENGAPADIFIAADEEWSNYLYARGLLVSRGHKNLLSNELVIIASASYHSKIVLQPEFNFPQSFTGRICTGDPESVPAGKYAKQALSYYGWWEAIAPRVAGSDSVRAALALVERGECALGIVYKTDAQLSNKVKIIARFPTGSHLPIVYPGAMTTRAGAEAHDFWNFLQGEYARQVYFRYGFKLPING